MRGRHVPNPTLSHPTSLCLQLERPLDRYLEPLATALQLRTSLTQEPNGLEVGEAGAPNVFDHQACSICNP
jgi:hypothetical protein